MKSKRIRFGKSTEGIFIDHTDVKFFLLKLRETLSQEKLVNRNELEQLVDLFSRTEPVQQLKSFENCFIPHICQED